MMNRLFALVVPVLVSVFFFLQALFSTFSDNINTDVFGANLYNQYLSQRKASGRLKQVARTRTIEHLLQADPSDWDLGAESCFSILVEVYCLA